MSDAGTTEVEATVLAAVRELVGELRSPDAAASVELDSVFDRELGLDSLELVELIHRVQEVLGIELAPGVLGGMVTPRDLAEATRRAARSARRQRPAVSPPLPLAPVATVPDHARSLLEAFEWHVCRHPDRLHIRILDESDTHDLSYGALQREAELAANGLVACDLAPGARVAIMLPTGADYFAAFLGALLAGCVPVPVYPPARPSQLEDHLRRHARILDNAGASVLVTVPEARRLSRLLRAHVEDLRHVVTPSELRRHGGAGSSARVGSDDVALLQYTSGSTGNPKGVVLTHANLLANIRAIGHAVAVAPTDVVVSWLPLYHDMGLIGAWLSSLYYGIPLVVMAPQDFLTMPARWLWAIHDHHGTLSAAPNFAFELCLRKISDPELEGLDLSSWRIACNGAEPVSAETVERFAARFAAYGFQREAMTPVYGLAESSVGLTFPPPGRGPLLDHVAREAFLRRGRAQPADVDDATALRFVACGQSLPGHEIRVVDAAGIEVGERQEGRIEFRGPSATAGYHANPEATKTLFHGGWLDTGDLGYLAAGDLYVTGRVKDIVIKAGRNLHPEELEEMVGNLPGVRAGRVAVFASPDLASGTEQLVVVAETREREPSTRSALHDQIVSATVDLLGTPPDDVVLAAPGTVLKTSSGKIRRAASRERYESGEIGRRRAPWWQTVRFAGASVLPGSRRAARMGAAFAYAAYCWAVLAVVGFPVAAVAVLLPRPSWRWWVAHRGIHLVLALTGTPLIVHGTEHLAPGRRLVVVANHPSYLDPFVLVAATAHPYCFVAGEVFARRPVSGFVLRRFGAEFVERGDREHGVADAQRLIEAARAGRTLVFFPEGSLSRIPGLRPFRMGAFVTAAAAGIPVVPVAIRGTRSILRAGRGFVRRGTAEVEVGEPVTPSGAGWDAAVELAQVARAAILARCAEPDLA